jgi:hypothetical protein
MTVTMAHTATQYLANSLTFLRGSAADVQRVGVYYGIDPNHVPSVTDFFTAQLVQPGDPLAEGNLTDVLARPGARPDADVALTPGDKQVWLLVVTTDEDIIVKVDTVTVL